MCIRDSPQSEYELNKNIKKYAKDKTVVIISHRLSTTCDMDRIYMFENGAIVERGTHSELLEKMCIRDRDREGCASACLESTLGYHS